MRQSLRATIRGLFVEPDRRLDLYFYTSSLSKYLHARTVLEQYGINLSHFKSRQDPYEESYLLGKEALLEAAVAEVRHSVGRGMLFFVEDTSLRIEALSSGDDVPGLAVKEWFQGTTFDALDRELRRRAKGRNAVVKSDIALNVPGVRQPVLFHGETAGRVAESPSGLSGEAAVSVADAKELQRLVHPQRCEQEVWRDVIRGVRPLRFQNGGSGGSC